MLCCWLRCGLVVKWLLFFGGLCRCCFVCCLFVVALGNAVAFMCLGLCLVFVFGFWLTCLVVTIASCGYGVVVWGWLRGACAVVG